MDFSIPAETQALLDKARKFVDEELIPLEAGLFQKTWPEVEAILKPKRDKVKALGMWAPGLPKDVGGMGLTLMELGLLFEVMGRTPIGSYAFGAQAPDAGNAELLHKYGTKEQKEKFLLPLARGEIRSCFAMTERYTSGSNPTLLKATAVKEGDEYVINGHKWFTSSADGSSFTIVMAVTNPTAAPHLRASMILVPTDHPGMKRVRNIPVMGHAGGGYFSHAEVMFENCRVPVSSRLGPEGMGFVLAQDRLGPGRIHHCMRWLGICGRSLDLLIDRASTREVMEGQKLGDQQFVQGWIADSFAEIQAARILVLQAAWNAENHGFKAARAQIGMIKYFAANVLQKVVDRALQAHGALGMTDDTILAFFYREERAARIYDGPDEVHRISVARQLMKKAAKAKLAAA